MSRIAFILLAHERADQLIDLVSTLLEADPSCYVVIHYDANASDDEYRHLREHFGRNEHVHFPKTRVRCGWGEFGLVEATVRALKLIRKRRLAATHVMLLSGSCMPVRPLAELNAFLDANPSTEFIESQNKDWITGGLKEERYHFWYPVGFKSHPALFQLLTGLQKKLTVRRSFPTGLQPRFGSQWWCLTWETCKKVLDWVHRNPKKYRFFKTIWIPDECFFQTIVWHITKSIDHRTLTFYRFNKYGKPIVFFDEAEAFLKGLPYFFARKISPSSVNLRKSLRFVASAPAGITPLLDSTAKHALSFEQILGETQLQSKPGQLFHPTQIAKGWPGPLQDRSDSFAVLFGPPPLTRIAADGLRGEPALSVLGRLLKPDEVDFGPGIEALGALRRHDCKIRDMDPALYLSRIFDRVKGFPVFELSYLDDPALARSIFRMPNAVVLPILPLSNWTTCSSLFWLLSLPDEKLAGQAFQPSDKQAPYSRQLMLDALLDEVFSRKAIDALNRLLYTHEPPAQLRLIASLADQASAPMGARRLEFEHGPNSLALSEALVRLDQALASRSLQEMEHFIPPRWKAHFRPLTRIQGM